MNQRLKQITGQVLDEIVPETWTTLGYDKIKEIQNRTAELIIRECIGEVYPETFKVDGVEPANLADAVKRIKQHFGVEE